jgi:aconitate hydratase
MSNDPFGARGTLETALGTRAIARLDAIDGVERLPYSIKVLLESALRNIDGVHRRPTTPPRSVRPRSPSSPVEWCSRTSPGYPPVVDLAAMRAAIVRMTGDEDAAEKVNPLIPATW